jgi:hypothetical protein
MIPKYFEPIAYYTMGQFHGFLAKNNFKKIHTMGQFSGKTRPIN